MITTLLPVENENSPVAIPIGLRPQVTVDASEAVARVADGAFQAAPERQAAVGGADVFAHVVDARRRGNGADDRRMRDDELQHELGPAVAADFGRSPRRQRVALPGYAFQRSRHWVARGAASAAFSTECYSARS